MVMFYVIMDRLYVHLMYVRAMERTPVVGALQPEAV